MPEGTVKLFNPDRGYGFIKPDAAAADVFFHVSDVAEQAALLPGQRVQYDMGVDKKTGKGKAVQVRRV